MKYRQTWIIQVNSKYCRREQSILCLNTLLRFSSPCPQALRFHFHLIASQSPANKLLYGCTIDFTFTRPDLKGLWDCPWIPNLCATNSQSVKSTATLFCKLARLFTQQDLPPFILQTTVQANPAADSPVIAYRWKWSGVVEWNGSVCQAQQGRLAGCRVWVLAVLYNVYYG